MELQNIVLQSWLMPTDYSRYCGLYRYNKKMREVVSVPVSHSMYPYKMGFVDSNGRKETDYCFWVFGENFQFPMKSVNRGQFLRKLQNKGIETQIHTKIISELIRRRYVSV